MLAKDLAERAGGDLTGHAVDVDLLPFVLLAHGLVGLLRLQVALCGPAAAQLLLLLVNIDDVFHQQVALEPVHAVAVEDDLEAAGGTTEDAPGEAVGVARVVEVAGAAAAQVVLAGQDDHGFGEHVQADGAAQLLLQAVHGARGSNDGSCPLNVHAGKVFVYS